MARGKPRPAQAAADPGDRQLQFIRESFVFESHQELAEIEQKLLDLEKSPGNLEPLKTVCRFMHTIKGNAVALGFPAVVELTHAAEEILAKLRDGTLPVEGPRISLLLESVDGLRKLIVEAVMNAAISDRGGLLSRLADGAKGPAPAPVSGAGTAGKENDLPAAAPLRVEGERLERLTRLAEESFLAQERLQGLLRSRVNGGDPELGRACEAVRGLAAKLRDELSRIRLAPIGPMLRQEARAALELSERLGKPADLVVQGGELELDAAWIDRLRDPFMHLIRNAVDHGLEPPKARQALGKNPRGKITLRAFLDKGEFVVEIEDDGAGFDRKRIVEKAMARGLISAPPASEEQIYRLTFLQGFSTNDAATETSGRGVGMDIVLRGVESLGGRLGVRSREGLGACVTLRLPGAGKSAIVEGS